jgi:hypothetical protein
MQPGKTFQERLTFLLDQAVSLEDNFPEEQVESVALRLQDLNFVPPLVIDNAIFLRLRKQGVIDEISRIAALPEAQICVLGGVDSSLSCDDQRLQHISVLLFYFKKLLALRAGDPGEWDEIDELYVHD